MVFELRVVALGRANVSYQQQQQQQRYVQRKILQRTKHTEKTNK